MVGWLGLGRGMLLDLAFRRAALHFNNVLF
jgi:hypothetical protein